MKAFFISTGTFETAKHHESFACLHGNKIMVWMYNHKHEVTPAANNELLSEATAYAPDVIVYIGAANNNTPSPATFSKLKNTVAPIVHFCSDAADPPWWPFIETYDRENCFSLQVALDGSKQWPQADNHMTALTVMDHSIFPKNPSPHSERKYAFGFSGNTSGERDRKLQHLPGIALRHRERGYDTYMQHVNHLLNTGIEVNFARTGSGNAFQVKGRVLESGLAGCMLLEEKGSPTSDWFTPGEDYLEYESLTHAMELVKHYTDNPDESQKIADRLRKKVRKLHGPKIFWQRIFDRVGL